MIQVRKYSKEESMLRKLIPENIWNLYKEARVVLAGGAITSLFTNSDINDFDLYFKNKISIVKTLATIFGYEEYGYSSGGVFDLACCNGSDKSLQLLDKKGNNHQFIIFKSFDHVQEIFDSFDFTICMGAFDFETETFILHPDFLKHNSQRFLSFNNKTDYPIISLLRKQKYENRGYSTSKVEVIKIAFACMLLDIKNWEEAKAQLGGLYGFDLDKVFEEDKEFSCVELLEQLEKINEKDLSTYIFKNGEEIFIDLLIKLFPLEGLGMTRGTYPFLKDKYYKQVRYNFSSLYCQDNNIKYNLNEIIPLQRHGIFVHKDPRISDLKCPQWVELELLNGSIEHTDKDNELKLMGDVKVTKQFELLNPESITSLLDNIEGVPNEIN